MNHAELLNPDSPFVMDVAYRVYPNEETTGIRTCPDTSGHETIRR